ncbi:hypothetical protein GCM10014715_16210 [Streptomyces spiralis]|uniref:Uncharacterized protein n=1 Tax=Streptomyces spiralis TaxID=66376 RepID=A0A918ZPP3_9ACTN|nr:hypothetical protein GCM10014715_16210 [Streptomyces spiralis]
MGALPYCYEPVLSTVNKRAGVQPWQQGVARVSPETCLCARRTRPGCPARRSRARAPAGLAPVRAGLAPVRAGLAPVRAGDRRAHRRRAVSGRGGKIRPQGP